VRGHDAADVVIQEVVIAPGGHTGWHSHSGPALVVVQSGALTLYEADDRRCQGTTHGAGTSFLDHGYGNVHIGRNEGTLNVVLWVTYLDVPIGGGVRIDVADPKIAACNF